jgi:arylsulfatase A-like enzyme
MGSSPNKRPNVVLFVHDSWRWDVMGHMGNPAAQTPVHDRLVETDAVSFSSAFCQNPVCVPSRCSFMTGWYTHVRGHRAMEYGLESGEPMLLQNMMRSGYHVWWAGRTHEIHSDNDVNDYCSEYYPLRNADGLKPNWSIDRRGRSWAIDGSTEWRGDPETSDQYYSFYVGEIDTKGEPYYFDGDWAVVEAAIERIKTYDSDQPFCLYLPLTYPHPPYAVDEPWYSAIDRAAIPDRVKPPSDWSLVPSHIKGIHDRNRMANWTEDRWRELRAVYYAMCARVDHQLGKVVEALQEAGLYDDTALFSFSDHGDFTGDYNLLEGAEHLPGLPDAGAVAGQAAPGHRPATTHL